MELSELTFAVLTRDYPEVRLRAGDVGTVVHVYDSGAGFELEFMNGAGKTLDVLTVSSSDVRAIAPTEVLHVRDTSSTN